MIKTIRRSDRHNMYDLKVRMMVDQILKNCETLEDFEKQFAEKIKLIPQMSGYSPAFTYILKQKDFYLQVCHKNTMAKVDRILFDVFDIRESGRC